MVHEVESVTLTEFPPVLDNTRKVKELADELISHKDKKIIFLAAAAWMVCDALEAEKSADLPLTGIKADGVHDQERSIKRDEKIKMMKVIADLNSDES